MADVFCKFCGEPCDMDEFHNGTDSFREIYRLFQQNGCPIADQAIDGLAPAEMTIRRCENQPVASAEFLDAVEAIQDLLGDDVDGVASMLGDYRDML